MLLLPAEGFVNLHKAHNAAGGVDLQIDVQHPSLFTGETEPRPSLCQGDAKLHQKEALSGFGRSGNQHLMTAAKNALDQLGGQFRQIILIAVQGDEIRQLIGGTFHEIHPVNPGLSADIGRHQILAVSVPGCTGHTRKPGGIAVLLVHRHAVLFQKIIQIFHALAVLVVVGCVDPHDGVQALTAAMHQASDGQFQLPVHSVLICQRHRVRLHQGKAEGGDIVISNAGTVHRIEAYPRTSGLFPVANGGSKIRGVLFQRGKELPGSATIVAFAGSVSAVRLPHIICHDADIIVRLEEGLQVGLKLLHRIPVIGCHIRSEAITVFCDGIVPGKNAVFATGSPATIPCHLHDGATFDSTSGCSEGAPFTLTFSGMIAAVVTTPALPNGAVIALCLQCHTHLHPFLI